MALEARRAPDDIRPTLTDEKVLEFCKTGMLTLEGVIPESTNRWVYDYLDREDADPHQLVRDECFIDEVLLHPAVAGVIRSLLGAHFQLPEWMANHRLVGPVEASYWHIDAGSDFERACNLLQVFYIPQGNTPEMGPTLFLPGSHLVPIAREDRRALRQSGRPADDRGAGGLGVCHSLFDLAPPAAEGRSFDAQPVEMGLLAHRAARTGLGGRPELRFRRSGLYPQQRLLPRSGAACGSRCRVWPRCSTGCAAKRMNFTWSAAQDGRTPPPIRDSAPICLES